MIARECFDAGEAAVVADPASAGESAAELVP